MGFHNSLLFFSLSITFLFQSVLHLPIVAAKDTLFPGDNLDSTSVLLSPGGTFTLGFFTITTPSSYNLTYLGIWYTNDLNGVKVWIANRDKPVVQNATLKLHDSGTLRLINQRGATLFNISNNKVSSAMLKESGNFILYDGTNRMIWQSFDHPTDTLIPGMKIGYNLTTGQNWTLTSSTDNGFVSSGAFTLRLELYQNSPQLLIHRRGQLYWAGAPWNDSSVRDFDFGFSDYPRTYFWNQYKMNVISDASGMYFTFQTSVSSILRLSPAGYFADNSINNFYRDYVPPPYFCYGYQMHDDHGCAVELPYCRATHSGSDDRFWHISDLLASDYKIENDSSISIGDCMERCWNDCNCTACSTYNNGTGCIYSTYNPGDYYRGNVSRVYLRYSSKYENIWERKLFYLLLLVPILVLAYVSTRRRILKGMENRRRDDFIQQMTGSNSFNYGDELERGIKDAPEVKIFSLKAIMAATNKFSDENKLGKGGYGPVYKGELSDGREIAVKRLSKSSGQGILEFKSELILISKLQHTNLVRLYGCCVHQEEKMLIYEFMPNKSLDFFLFAQDEKEKLGWHVRFNIIEGIAQGLLYLHRFSRMKVIHRDLKVSNVLLDENMNPKIADFGMARIFQQNVTEAVTHRIVGTYGYMAPEYAIEGTFSIKSDVFSFGVLILEIVSGRRNSRFYNPDRPLNLVGYAWKLWKGHASLELKDVTLKESYDVKQLLRVIHVGLLCVQDNADDRPTMSDVIYILKNDNIDLPSPKKPAFFTGRQKARFRLNIRRSTDRPVPSSEIRLTITTMEAR